MRLSVTTPRGSLVEAEVDEVTAPGALGEFGILPQHVPFLSALKPGVFVYRIKADSHILAVGEGVLEVVRVDVDAKGDASATTEKVIVLVSEAQHAGEIDAAAAAKEVTTADHDLAHWKGELGGDYKALQSRRAWAQARSDAAGRLSRAPS
jgi:F-type H+-transporting ATPase subunit epsilon